MAIKIIVFILLFFIMIKKHYKIPTIALAILAFFNLFGFITFDESIKCFASENIAIYFGISIITEVLIKNGFIDHITNLIFSKTKKFTVFFLIIITIVSFLSIVVSLKITILFFLNLIFSIEKKFKGKISKKTGILFTMAEGCASSSIIIFSTKLLLANEILLEFGVNTISNFYFLPFSIINLIILIVYILIRRDTFFVKKLEIAPLQKQPIKNKKNNIIASTVLLSCIILPIFTNINAGLICVMGALICIITNCISEKESVQSVNWWIILYLGSIKAISKVLNNSFIFDSFGNYIQNFINENTPIILIIIVISIASGIICCLIDNKFAISTLLPICLIISKNVGIDPVVVVSSIVIGANFSILSPIDTTNNIILEECNLKIKDLYNVAFPYVITIYVSSVLLIYFNSVF